MPPRSIHSHGKSEIKARPQVMREVARQRRRLGERLRVIRDEAGLTQEVAAEAIGLHVKHLQRLERGGANATIATLVACGLAYGTPLASLFATPEQREPFVRLPQREARPFQNAIPLYDLRAVAGRFGALQTVEPEAWVAPRGRTLPAQSLFAARVIGESMNRRIPIGSYCIFRIPASAPLNGKIVLVQHRHIEDPESGGQYSVKRLKITSTVLRLESLSTSRLYRPMIFRGRKREELTILAELVEVL